MRYTWIPAEGQAVDFGVGYLEFPITAGGSAFSKKVSNPSAEEQHSMTCTHSLQIIASLFYKQDMGVVSRILKWTYSK
ncbi:hypothetical protein [Bacillus sp. SJS]|uniref:hypothetical protein n=1 Tax=Bacillus sp. SJS TaxID=1423321 RepID=UPI0004DD77AC|nr:hypothetical protein [Bacillus sp. SJS]KZZ84744.1 hypothetical protein AS29_009440 [Bacillus sp. SJS]